MAISDELKSNKNYLISKLEEYGCHTAKYEYQRACCFCPSHDALGVFESNKSKGVWKFKCQSCGENGTVIDLVMKYENIDQKEAIKKLCEEFNIDMKTAAQPKAEKVFKSIKEESEIEEPKVTEKKKEEINNFILQANKNASSTDYFHKRGFSDETINKYKLGFMPNYTFKSKNGKDVRFGDAIIIPYPGEDYYILRYLNPPEGVNKYKKLPGQEPLFNLKGLAPGEDPIYIVEGQFDCLSFLALGVTCIGLNGAAGINKFIELVKNNKVHRPFIIALDNDNPGIEASKKLREQLNELNIYSYNFELPKGYKDANELLVKDKDKLQELILIASEKALNEFKEFKKNKEEQQKQQQQEQKQQQNKIYGDYEYLKSSNRLFKIDMKASTDGQPMKDYKFIYDGMIKVVGISINIDTDVENIILNSKMDFEVEKEFEKGIVFGSQNKFMEALNNKNGFRVKPDKAVQKRLQNYIYDQYEGMERDKALNEKYITERIGFIKNNKQRQKIDTFVYPNSEITLGNNLYYIEDGNYNNIFTSRGTAEEWVNNILRPCLKSDNMKIMLLSTFASIVIEPLEVHENFIVELSGNTGTSKTTALNVCASVFGAPTKYITDWRTTSTAAISKASELNVFPLMLDDTKKCDDKKIISSLVYSLSSGKDKARSDVTGKAREVKTFKNITITCGEVPLHDYLTEGRGALSRFIPLEGGALEKSNINKEIADRLNRNTNRYYGSIGLEFIKWLVKKISDDKYWSMINDLYMTYMQQLPLRATSEMSQRRCNHIALLRVTGNLLEDFLGQDYFNYEELTDNLVVSVNQNSIEVDIINAAYEGLMEFCNKNSVCFYKESNSVDNPILNTATIYERTNTIGQYKDGYYMFYDKTDLANILEQYGDLTDILRNFRDRGYLITNKGSTKFAKSVAKLTDKKVKRMYVINPKPYEEAIQRELEEQNNQDIQSHFTEVTFIEEEIPF